MAIRRDWANYAAEGIWSDMNDRLDMDASDVDDDVREEILRAWAEIIRYSCPTNDAEKDR